jgi:hypothetical protein
MRLIGFCCAIVAAMAVIAPAADAQIAITDWRAQVYDSNAVTEAEEVDANVFTQAGGHPYIGVTDFSLGGTTSEDNVATIRVDVPPGLVPNPAIYPTCTLAQLQLGNSCPTNSQIGTQQISIVAALPGVGSIPVTIKVPLYNIEIEADQVSRFGFNPADAATVPGLGPVLSLLGLHEVEIIGGVRDALADANPVGAGANQLPADNGLFFRIDVSPTTPRVTRAKLTFWGTPGDPGHAAEVGESCITAPVLPVVPGLLPGGFPGGEVCAPDPTPGPAPDPDLPFLANPTACTGTKLSTRLIVTSESGASATDVDQTPTIDGQEGAQGCELVPFAADFALLPDTVQPDAPTGPAVRLNVPQEGLNDTDVLTTSHVRAITVTMPPGMTINPSVANGLEACTDAQFAVNAGVPGGDACPDASQIGTVSVETPLLPPLPGEPAGGPDQVGNAYVGQPLAGDMYRLFVTIEGRGNSIRLKGSVRPDPNTGQITASFPDNPQLPFGELTVDFRDGPRAPLATPNLCGPVAGAAQLAPWSGTAPVNAQSDPFDIAGAGCPIDFRTTLVASTASTASGAFTPFTLGIGRGDRNQFLSGVRVDTPPGLAARIKGVTKCSNAAANTGACPAASRIGTVSTAAGAGPDPYTLSGPVYFTEGYKGAPFGMVAVIRAIAGPYDLGTVVVRQSIWVNPDDASLAVTSDPLPQILEGVPIRLRSISVTLDMRDFTYNPTSCGAKEVGGRMHSIQGIVSDRNTSLAFDGCERLGFAPKLKMRLTGARQLTRGKHPGLRATVTQPARQANIATARVVLPKSLALDPENAQAVCGFEAGLRAKCPRKTRIGKAIARSPVLNKALRGPVYFVQGIRVDPTTGARIRTLPTLLAKLNGEIRINVRASTDVTRGKLVSTFENVPDAPVRRFDLRLKGGKGGILAATGRPAICGRRQVAVNKTIGHNGKRAAQKRVKLGKPCKKFRRIQAKKRKAQQRKRAATRRAAT